MEYHKHFYITLFRNASQKVRSNTLAEFTIQLAQRIDLGSTDNWKVGLCEFSYPPSKSGTLEPVSMDSDKKSLDLLWSEYTANCG